MPLHTLGGRTARQCKAVCETRWGLGAWALRASRQLCPLLRVAVHAGPVRTGVWEQSVRGVTGCSGAQAKLHEVEVIIIINA